jgi:hypothetical protein
MCGVGRVSPIAVATKPVAQDVVFFPVAHKSTLDRSCDWAEGFGKLS